MTRAFYLGELFYVDPKYDEWLKYIQDINQQQRPNFYIEYCSNSQYKYSDFECIHVVITHHVAAT